MEFENTSIEIDDVVLEYEAFKEYARTSNMNWAIKIWRGIGISYISIFILVLIIMLSFEDKGGLRINTSNLLSWDIISRLSGFLFMIFILFIVPWFIYPLIVNRMSRKAFENNKLIQKPQKYVFDDFGFKVTSANGESRFKWVDMFDVKETKSYLALYISKYQAFIIPRRFLENRLEIIDFIRNKVKTNK